MRKCNRIVAKLIEYYDRHIKQIGPSASQLSVNIPVQTAPIDRENIRGLTAGVAYQIGTPLYNRAVETQKQLEKIREQLGLSAKVTVSPPTDTSETTAPSTSKPVTVDALTYALESLVQMAQDMSQVMQDVRSKLNEQKHEPLELHFWDWLADMARRRRR